MAKEAVMKKRGPDFIILGQMKCATTSLYGSLCSSPQFIPVQQKEIHFFSFEEFYTKGIEYYEEFFPVPDGKSLTGEASPSYLCVHAAAARIHKHYPDVKLIVCLRDPGTRAISQYYHEVNRGAETRPIEEVFSDPGRFFDNGYVQMSMYAPKILWYLNFFQPHQLCAFVFESFIKNPEQTLEQVFSFLELEKPDTIPVYSLSGATPPTEEPTQRQRLAKNVSDYCRDVTESLMDMSQRHGFTVAGDLRDLLHWDSGRGR
jgi:hypothetical protein